MLSRSLDATQPGEELIEVVAITGRPAQDVCRIVKAAKGWPHGCETRRGGLFRGGCASRLTTFDVHCRYTAGA